MPALEPPEARRRFAAQPVARLATTRPDGAPHVVPITFAVLGDDRVVSAVDHKPKTTTALQRLANLAHDPRCAILADRYDEDWSQLWWVRADGRATVVDTPPADHPGLGALVARYAPYREQPPRGPLIVVQVTAWRGWSAT